MISITQQMSCRLRSADYARFLEVFAVCLSTSTKAELNMIFDFIIIYILN